MENETITIPNSIFKGIGRFFYVIDPEETSYYDENLVPEFFVQVSVILLLFNYYVILF
jgi:hypothetical protein